MGRKKRWRLILVLTALMMSVVDRLVNNGEHCHRQMLFTLEIVEGRCLIPRKPTSMRRRTQQRSETSPQTS